MTQAGLLGTLIERLQRYRVKLDVSEGEPQAIMEKSSAGHWVRLDDLSEVAALPPAPPQDKFTKNADGDWVCEHGTASDVHCCGCHSGFLFDAKACTCLNSPRFYQTADELLRSMEVHVCSIREHAQPIYQAECFTRKDVARLVGELVDQRTGWIRRFNFMGEWLRERPAAPPQAPKSQNEIGMEDLIAAGGLPETRFYAGQALPRSMELAPESTQLDAEYAKGWNDCLAEMRVAAPPQAPLHASAPAGYKCADCTLDKEPCPRCYQAWWQKKHPNVQQIVAASPPAPVQEPK